MMQLRDNLDLAQKSIRAPCRREARVNDLHGDFASMLQVRREIDGRHSPTSQLSLEPMPLRGSIRTRRGGLTKERGEHFRCRLSQQRSLTLALREQRLELGAPMRVI